MQPSRVMVVSRVGSGRTQVTVQPRAKSGLPGPPSDPLRRVSDTMMGEQDRCEVGPDVS